MMTINQDYKSKCHDQESNNQDEDMLKYLFLNLIKRGAAKEIMAHDLGLFEDS